MKTQEDKLTQAAGSTKKTVQMPVGVPGYTLTTETLSGSRRPSRRFGRSTKT